MMGCLKVFFVLFSIGIIASILSSTVFLPAAKLEVDLDACWGKTCSQAGVEVQVAPFDVHQDVLDDLYLRLKMARKLKPGIVAYKGMDLDFLEKAIAFWRDEYDWRAIEKKLNTWNPKYAIVDGLRVHFLHVPPSDPSRPSRPLLLLHGWPGSIWEFSYLIEELNTNYREKNFELVIPSLPGFGFSEASKKKGLDCAAMGVMFSKLMTKGLNIKSYWVQGGDFGSVIAHTMAITRPSSEILGVHVNFPMASRPWWSFPYTFFLENSERERRKILPIHTWLFEVVETIPYLMFHMTRPRTIAYMLDSSPVSLASYILDKFHVWSDPSTEYKMQDLITNLMFFWLPQSNVGSIEIYKNTFWPSQKRNMLRPTMDHAVFAPFGISDFKHEIKPPLEINIRTRYKDLVLLAKEDSHGGHFAALENPEALASHICQFIDLVEARQTENSNEKDIL